MHITPISRYSNEILAITRQNNLAALENFIQQKRETDANYTPPLHDLLQAATDCRAPEIAAYCLENGQKASGGIMTSVVTNSSFAVYRLLIEYKAVNINYYVGWYGDILGTKAHSNELDWVRFCLAHGADPNLNKVHDNITALACAVSTGNLEMVELMLRHGAKIEGSGAIVMAAIENNMEMLRFLLDRGADIDEVGIEGPAGDECYEDMGSALHQAATEGYTEMALFLIDAGANIYLKDLLGRTAEDLASEKGHAEILSALRRKLGAVKE
ncbi:ankyrin repeat domain-containing protein [Aspergillus stella-maris]|uniref:ankyrin repeat domain-containing protein n=1 Tax=Aspergillus stella-maris TaxID=1810926 RepID=UPI003CCDCBDC